MSYETIITITCLILAATVLTVSFRFAHWRNRAERAESALARIEATIRECEHEVAI